MGAFFSQSFFIPKSSITERTCPDQTGRVFIVTGGYTGLGLELSRILHARNATVYLAGRSESKADDALTRIQKANPQSSGRVEFLRLDLANLSTIKPAVESFTSKEQKLDVLINNAAVMFPSTGSTTAQSHDLQVGTNCLGPYLLYRLLASLLTRTAASAPKGSVRVTWAASVGVDVLSPKPGGMKLDADGCPKDLGTELNYAQTKVGNVFLAKELARKTPESGIVHVAFNPGNLKTELQRHWKGLAPKMGELFLFHPAVEGAHTELWTAVAPEVTVDRSGAYVWPWGRLGGIRKDVEAAAKSEGEGGTGLAGRFVAWCDEETKPFA